MKARNIKEIRKSYLHFILYLAACIFVGVFIFYCYLKTSTVEVDRIVSKTEEYDKIYVRQTDLVGRIDSLYQYMTMFNTNKNDMLLQTVVSKHKQEIMSSADDMGSKNVRLYQKLMSEVNTFLAVKDSIRLLKIEEELVRSDLMKCVEDNKQAGRRLTIGNITVTR